MLDITTAGTGPLAVGFLADHGATVVMIESKTRPNLNRVSAPYRGGVPNLNTSGLMTPFCTSRYSFGLNMGTAEGRELAKRLALWADIVASSYSPGVMERWGLGYEALSKLKPEIIMLAISMEGQTGPHANVAGWGFGMKGLSGLVHFTGWSDKEGCGVPMAYADTTTPWFATIALLSALEHKRQTGKGQFIDFSQMEAALNFTPSYYLLDYEVNRRITSRQGNYSEYATPHGVYRCKGEDSWVAIAVCTDEEWSALCRAMDDPGLARSAQFASFLLRQRNRDELDRRICQWTMQHEAEEVMLSLQHRGVACGKVQTFEDLLERDPQVKHRGYFQVLEHDGVGRVAYHTPPARLTKAPAELRPTPMLGEHTEYVAKEIFKMSDTEFADLLAKGVLEMEL